MERLVGFDTHTLERATKPEVIEELESPSECFMIDVCLF
jgi:hypothetical protein